MDNTALKNWLVENSTPEELAEIKRLEEKQRQNKRLTNIEKQTLENVEYGKKMVDLLSTIADSMKKQGGKADPMESFSKMITEKLEEMGGKITTSYEKNKPFNAAGVYKDMINQLSAVKDSIDNKPVPVWNWPQYASVGVRNKSFTNINPSVSPFGIDDYDDIIISGYDVNNNPSTVTYKSSGNTTAVLTLYYDDSGNLTEAKRTT